MPVWKMIKIFFDRDCRHRSRNAFGPVLPIVTRVCMVYRRQWKRTAADIGKQIRPAWPPTDELATTQGDAFSVGRSPCLGDRAAPASSTIN
jgi:hypothetical protein